MSALRSRFFSSQDFDERGSRSGRRRIRGRFFRLGSRTGRQCPRNEQRQTGHRHGRHKRNDLAPESAIACCASDTSVLVTFTFGGVSFVTHSIARGRGVGKPCEPIRADESGRQRVVDAINAGSKCPRQGNRKPRHFRSTRAVKHPRRYVQLAEVGRVIAFHDRELLFRLIHFCKSLSLRPPRIDDHCSRINRIRTEL